MKIENLLNFIKFTLIVLAVTLLANNYITQVMTLTAIRDCSGSPSCIESTASVLLYHSTPCLDGYSKDYIK